MHSCKPHKARIMRRGVSGLKRREQSTTCSFQRTYLCWDCGRARGVTGFLRFPLFQVSSKPNRVRPDRVSPCSNLTRSSLKRQKSSANVDRTNRARAVFPTAGFHSNRIELRNALVPPRAFRKRAFLANLLPRSLPGESLFYSAPFARF